MAQAVKKEVDIDPHFDDSNYPGSELTLEQEADLMVDRLVGDWEKYKAGTLKTYTRKELAEFISCK